MYRGVQRSETGGERAPRGCVTKPAALLAGKRGICSLAARAAQLHNQDRWDQSETPAGPRSVRSAEGRPCALRSFRGRRRRAAASAFAPRSLRSVRRPLSASLVMAVGLASPTLLSSRAPPPPQGPRGPSRGGPLRAWLWDLLLKQEMRGLGPTGIGSHGRTSARPLLCSETRSTAGEHGRGGVSASRRS